MHERKRGLRILVVDDNYDGATVLSVLLELMGHRTTTAYNGLEAFEAAAVIGQLRPAPILIACSGWYDAESRRRTSDLGFSAHLRKPVGLDALEAALDLAYARPEDEPHSVWPRGFHREMQGISHPNELG